ncbi:SIR2 family protein [Streptococcus uberis]|uniref:SIR2 family protein n=1 Tax=Streptococcus uberis TaxID=1349 RepID=UPI00248B4B74|nr:SIR2 family protein [Streptococcus uberis]
MLITLIQSLIMNNTLLFVGYSLEDSTFNSIFRLIQNSFSYDAKIAYFYTTSKPSNIVREYYRKKGIYIISNESDELKDEASRKDIDSRYYLTQIFFNEILENNQDNIINSIRLWDKISFLDKMNFVEINDIHKYSRLSNRAIHLDDKYNWVKESESNFDITNIELINFVKEKTLLRSFFNINLPDERQIRKNDLLFEPYQLYKEKKYKLAKVKYREIANLSFQRKDYINFLICEFNFNHIHDSWGPEENDYPNPIISVELEQLTQQLIDSLSGDDKKIIEYFRDNILNMHFLYSKLEKINDLFDKIRDENQNYRNGGRSFNNNLNKSAFLIRNLQQFLDSNCLCVEQYAIYKSIINRYLEILLLSYDNANTVPKTTMFGNETTSSILKEIDLEDVKIILPNIDKNKIKYYLSNYSLSRIKISKEAKSYIFKRFDTLVNMNFSMIDDNFHEYRRILTLLSMIDYDELTSLIEAVGKINVNYELSSEIRGILKTIIEYSDLLTVEDKLSLEEILINQISLIEESNHSTFYSLYELYKIILDMCNTDEKREIKVEKLEIQLLKIKYNKIESSNIFAFHSLFLHFFNYLSEETQSLVLKILSTFTEENVSSEYYHNIIEIMDKKIFDFPNLRNFIYDSLINEINKKKSG